MIQPSSMSNEFGIFQQYLILVAFPPADINFKASDLYYSPAQSIDFDFLCVRDL